MSEQQFADAIGVSRAAVQQWERPDGTAPSRKNQPLVAAVLDIPLAELATGGSNISSDAPMRSEVPIVSEVEAGNYTIIDNFKHDRGLETVLVTVPVKRHTYALRVHGDSMVSEVGDSFPPGCLIIVEPEMAPMPGDYVIALLEPNQTTFKQLVKDGPDFFLKPLNLRYPIRPLANAKVIGVVRELTRRFR